MGNWYRSNNINNLMVGQKGVCSGNIINKISRTKKLDKNINFTSMLFHLLGEEK